MLQGLLRSYPYATGYILKMGTSVSLKKLIMSIKLISIASEKAVLCEDLSIIVLIFFFRRCNFIL
jgi:hypothetical protein